MPLHSRPIPAPKTPVQVSSNPTTYLARPEPHPAPPPTGIRRDDRDARAEPSRAPESRVESAPSDGTSQPWYRSEPWLAVMLAGFVPLLATLVAPEAAQYPLIGLTGLALVVGAVMLVRHGVFRSNPELKRHSE